MYKVGAHLYEGSIGCWCLLGQLFHVQVDSVMLVVTNSTELSEQRRLFERQMGELVVLIKEQTSCHQAIAESLAELKVFHYVTYYFRLHKCYLHSLYTVCIHNRVTGIR